MSHLLGSLATPSLGLDVVAVSVVTLLNSRPAASQSVGR
jgi:hypothetical protein